MEQFLKLIKNDYFWLFGIWIVLISIFFYVYISIPTNNTEIRGTIYNLTKDSLIIDYNNTEADLKRGQPTRQKIILNSDTQIIKQTFIEKDGSITGIIATQYDTPVTELYIGQSVYIILDFKTSTAKKIYIGDPALKF